VHQRQPARPGEAQKLIEKRPRLGQVLEHLKGKRQVEGAGRERQR
jgi:hypothetical protein